MSARLRVLLALPALFLHTPANGWSQPRTPVAVTTEARRTISFIRNAGQAQSEVLWQAQGRGFEALFTQDSFILRRFLDGGGSAPPASSENAAQAAPLAVRSLESRQIEVREHRIVFQGANRRSKLEPLDPQPARINLFRGNDPRRWVSGLETFARLRYKDLYPGIDLIFYSNHGSLEYDFVVAPGADPRLIRLGVHEDGPFQITESGDLQVGRGNEAVLHRPALYQNIDGSKRLVEGRFIALGRKTVGFTFPRYDRSKTLIVDPALSLLYSTYLGGIHDEMGSSVALDPQGNAYILGHSASQDYPVSGNAYQPFRKHIGVYIYNVVLTKISPSGVLLFSTFLGGNTNDYAKGNSYGLASTLTVDSQGNAYLTGNTQSPDFPVTANAYQKTYANGAPQMAFLSKISSDGSRLIYSTFFGGSGGSYGVQAVLGPQGTVYLTGSAGPGLPTTPGVFLPTISRGLAAFVAIFNLSLTGSTQLRAATYYGSAQPVSNSLFAGNFAYSLALDNSGNPWITGQTYTNNLPTTAGALQPALPSINSGCGGFGVALNSAAYFANLSADLTRLIYGSYLSGRTTGTSLNDCSEWGQAIKLDASGNLYLSGGTASDKFPTTPGSLQPAYPGPGGGDGWVSWVAKLNPSGTALVWSSYIGGNGGGTFPAAVVPDSQGNLWVGGATHGGSNFPITAGAYQPQVKGREDAHIMLIGSNGAQALYSTYLGGSGDETLGGLAIDSYSNVYVVGSTVSQDFPFTGNAFQKILANGNPGADGSDIYFTVLGGSIIGAVSPATAGNTGDATITISGAGFQAGATCTLTMGTATITASTVTIASDGSSLTCTFALNGAIPGAYNVVVSNPNAAALTLSNAFTVTGGGRPQIWINVISRPVIRTGVPSRFVVEIGNSGAANAYFTPLWIHAPAGTRYSFPGGFVINGADYSSAVGYKASDGSIYMPFLVPKLAAGQSLILPMDLTSAADAAVFEVDAYSDLPWFDSLSAASAALAAAAANPASAGTTCVSNSAKPYLRNCLGFWLNDLGKDIVQQVYNLSPTPLDPSHFVDQSPASSGPLNIAETWLAGQLRQALGLSVTPTASGAPGQSLPPPQLSGQSGPSDFFSNLFQNAFGGGQLQQQFQPRPSYPWPPNGSQCDRSELDVPCVGGSQIAEIFLNCQLPDGSVHRYYTSSEGSCQPQNPVNCFTPAPPPRVGVAGGGGQSCPSSGGSIDPNDKAGPGGDRSTSHYINGTQALSYMIAFENEPAARLPAAQVVITDQLDPTKMDLTTVALGPLAFANNTITPPSGVTSYNTVFRLNTTLSVRIQGSLDPATGLLKWTFTSIDPSTGLPPSDPSVGFLPPDTDGVQGQGSVTFTVMPKAPIATGTRITNQASVVFDANAPINTPTWLNTIDAAPPSSAVQPLPAAEPQPTFTVSWSGTDTASGIATYSVYVSDNGGPFTLWQSGVTATSAVYTGQAGHMYGFFSIATDRAGNVEGAKLGPETQTTVSSISPGCSLSLNPTSANLPSGAGTTGASLTGSFTLTATNCSANDLWTAVSDSPRLVITSPASGTGAATTATISYSMYTNSTTSPRVAHIGIAGLSFTVNQAPSSENQTQRVVRALYQTILGREPDSGGWAFWTGTGAPTDRSGAVLFNQMADGFYTSPEFSGSGFETLSLYQCANGNLPSFAAWSSAITQLRRGALSKAQLVNNLMGSLSNTAFVQQVIQNCWSRSATAGEVSQYTAQLAGSTSASPRLDFLENTIFQNALFKNQTNTQFVTMLYYTILLRDPDVGGLGFWTSQVNPPGGQLGIYYLYNPQPPTPQYGFKLAVIGQAVPPNPNLLGFLGSPEFQSLIR